MHPQARNYFARWARSPRAQGRIVEIGAQDMNGGIRDLFPQAKSYVSVDLSDEFGGVDVVADARTWRGPGYLADMVVCAEVYEHVPDWPRIVWQVARYLRADGLFVMTCAGPGRPPHSGSWAGPMRADEFYRNVDPRHLARVLVRGGFEPLEVLNPRDPSDVQAAARRRL